MSEELRDKRNFGDVVMNVNIDIQLNINSNEVKLAQEETKEEVAVNDDESVAHTSGVWDPLPVSGTIDTLTMTIGDQSDQIPDFEDYVADKDLRSIQRNSPKMARFKNTTKLPPIKLPEIVTVKNPLDPESTTSAPYRSDRPLSTLAESTSTPEPPSSSWSRYPNNPPSWSTTKTASVERVTFSDQTSSEQSQSSLTRSDNISASPNNFDEILETMSKNSFSFDTPSPDEIHYGQSQTSEVDYGAELQKKEVGVETSKKTGGSGRPKVEVISKYMPPCRKSVSAHDRKCINHARWMDRHT